MGLRFRKSINLGGGARINLSKSGVGYSFGVKGARITKTANGRTRKTIGIPNTGLSYVSESKGKSKKKSKSQSYSGYSAQSFNTQGLPAGTKFAAAVLPPMGVIIMVLSALLLFAVPLAGVFFGVMGVICFCMGRRYKKMINAVKDSETDESTDNL